MDKFTVRVNNVPDYAAKHRYIAVHIVDGELWFYGAFDDEAKAQTAATEYGAEGMVVYNETA